MAPRRDRIGERHQGCREDESPEDGCLGEETVGVPRRRRSGVGGGDRRALSQPRDDPSEHQHREGIHQRGEPVPRAGGDRTVDRQVAPRHAVHARRQDQRGGSEPAELEAPENARAHLIQTESVDQRSDQQRQDILARVSHDERRDDGHDEPPGVSEIRRLRVRVGQARRRHRTSWWPRTWQCSSRDRPRDAGNSRSR